MCKKKCCPRLVLKKGGRRIPPCNSRAQGLSFLRKGAIIVCVHGGFRTRALRHALDPCRLSLAKHSMYLSADRFAAGSRTDPSIIGLMLSRARQSSHIVLVCCVFSRSSEVDDVSCCDSCQPRKGYHL